jgi:hypothetical protein
MPVGVEAVRSESLAILVAESAESQFTVDLSQVAFFICVEHGQDSLRCLNA